MQSMSDMALAATMHAERMGFADVARTRRRTKPSVRSRLRLRARPKPALSPALVVPAQRTPDQAGQPAAARSVRLRGVVLDCSEPAVLADFYQAILGGDIRPAGPSDVDLDVDGQVLTFHQIIGYEFPGWGAGAQERVHLDFTVDQLDELHSVVLSRGGMSLDELVGADPAARLHHYADPCGHAFTLTTV